MRKCVKAALSCVLLFSGTTTLAVETSLLDRLAQEKIIGDAELRPQALPVPQPSISTHPAEVPETNTDKLRAENAQLAHQLHGVNERILAMQKKISDIERASALSARQKTQGQNARQGTSASGTPARTQDRNLARIRDLNKQLDAAVKQRNALAVELSNMKAVTDRNKSDGAALNAARTEITGLKKQTAELQAAKQELLSKAKSDDSALSTNLSTARTEIARLQKQVAELQAANKKLLEVSKSDSAVFSADLSAARAEIADLKKQAVDLQAAHQQRMELSTSGGATLNDDLNAARSEIANLKKRATELQVDNQQLIEKSRFDSGVFNTELKDARAEIASLKKQTAELQTGKRYAVNDKASKDVRTSYAVGTWYAETAAKETQKLAAIGKKLDIQAFSQGFNDKLNNGLQLSQDKLAAEINDAQKQLKAAMQSTEKQSKALMDAAAKEKGAVKMPDGIVYRVVDKGKAPTMTDRQEVVFEISEQLSTGEELNRETQAKRVQELSPLFQTIFRQLGVGGAAKILTPVTQAHADAMGLPTGTVSIIMVKIAGIK
ncbi:hypothetical protein DBR37_01895 [Herminiimonas sp. KBW02]|uniref:FKBP-type peptidyl-prolyl cis-trans isomerase N-terminal domain-containing protein n=1 Tax=Herminiimonas sp. KBW02 TaxID=2153363 RepID=UPI000F59BC12|nr:FKBP-type peptidyl-prolyl cis-trans isomerase N-terminal domain-containing protein [Herminiimonas sp. KBW02]RQO36974.1 hypothetical protein DBR37_01895 [Herminiimonas sp. KBW02]